MGLNPSFCCTSPKFFKHMKIKRKSSTMFPFFMRVDAPTFGATAATTLSTSICLTKKHLATSQFHIPQFYFYRLQFRLPQLKSPFMSLTYNDTAETKVVKEIGLVCDSTHDILNCRFLATNYRRAVNYLHMLIHGTQCFPTMGTGT